jgi:DNA-binding NtrC family response regulator
LAEGVLESELFGHEKGAFTGAASRRKGLFELAIGGTIFLDEVGELPLGTQVKLLRVLEEREFMRVGGTETLQTDARVVTATNRSLARDVEEGRFRQDLYFRLCVVRIDVPPLRERIEDIEPLFWHFLRQISDEVGKVPPQVSGQAVEKLGDHSWPGNVRELRNFVESVVIMRSGDDIRLEDVEAYVADRSRLNPRLPVLSGRIGEQASLELILDALVALKQEVGDLRRDLNLQQWTGPVHEIEVAHEIGQSPFSQKGKLDRQATSIEEMERDTIERALRKADGNRRKAAGLLGIGERTLYRKIQKYGLQDVR